MKKRNNTSFRLATGLLFTAMIAITARAQTLDPALNVLIKKGLITEQEARQAIADLEKAKNASASASTNTVAPAKTAGPPASTAEKPKASSDKDVRFFRKDGLNFQSADGKTFKGKIGGRIQYDVAGFDESDAVRSLVGHTPVSTEFRRARLYTSGEPVPKPEPSAVTS